MYDEPKLSKPKLVHELALTLGGKPPRYALIFNM